MLLKNIAIHECSAILNEIKITRLQDKELKLKLVHNYLELRKASNALMEDIQAIKSKFQDDWANELREVIVLRKNSEAIDEKKYADYLAAEKDANDALSAINEGETEVDLQPMETDAFVSAMGEDDITLSSIGYLSDMGVLV